MIKLLISIIFVFNIYAVEDDPKGRLKWVPLTKKEIAEIDKLFPHNKSYSWKEVDAIIHDAKTNFKDIRWTAARRLFKSNGKMTLWDERLAILDNFFVSVGDSKLGNILPSNLISMTEECIQNGARLGLVYGKYKGRMETVGTDHFVSAMKVGNLPKEIRENFSIRKVREIKDAAKRVYRHLLDLNLAANDFHEANKNGHPYINHVYYDSDYRHLPIGFSVDTYDIQSIKIVLKNGFDPNKVFSLNRFDYNTDGSLRKGWDKIPTELPSEYRHAKTFLGMFIIFSTGAGLDLVLYNQKYGKIKFDDFTQRGVCTALKGIDSYVKKLKVLIENRDFIDDSNQRTIVYAYLGLNAFLDYTESHDREKFKGKKSKKTCLPNRKIIFDHKKILDTYANSKYGSDLVKNLELMYAKILNISEYFTLE